MARYAIYRTKQRNGEKPTLVVGFTSDSAKSIRGMRHTLCREYGNDYYVHVSDSGEHPSVLPEGEALWAEVGGSV